MYSDSLFCLETLDKAQEVEQKVEYLGCLLFGNEPL